MHNFIGNEAQQRAIKHGAGPMLVLAGPGSGKTFVITKRIQYLIEHYSIEPSEILVVTFTRAAAKEMKQRFFSLGQKSPVNFGTFHAIFYSILKDFYHDKLDKAVIENNNFDSLTEKCYDLLIQNEVVLKKWQSIFRYIMIDEFQDINNRQYQIIQMLALPENNIFIVGDDDQSIYGFRGSNPNSFSCFEQDYPNVEKIILNINYRSTQTIVTFAEDLIRKNKNRMSKSISAANTGGEAIGIESFETKEIQYDELVKHLEIEKKKNQLSTLAIIFRTGHEMMFLAKKLEEKNIPYYTKEKMMSLYEHTICQDIVAVLLFSNGEHIRKHFLRFMNKPMRYINRNLLDEHVELTDLAGKYDGRKEIRQYILELKQQLLKMQNMPVYMAIHYFRQVMRYDDYICNMPNVSEQKKAEWFRIADILQESSKRFRNVTEWINYLKEEAKHQVQEREAENKKENGVALLTMHGSKGLEFETVYIPNCNEGVIPHRKARKQEEIEEERRLFYVAVTRARKKLVLQYITGTKDCPFFPSRFIKQ